MTNKLFQNNAIIGYLRKHHTGLTTIEAMRKLDIASFTKRISELRRAGYKIIAHKETTGDGVYYNRYFLL